MAGRYLRDSKGRYAGSTTGWQKGKRVARRAQAGARRKVNAYNNKVLRQEAFAAKGKMYERGLTRGDRNARVAASVAGGAAGRTLAGPVAGPLVGRVGSGYASNKVASRQQQRSLTNGTAKAINRKRAGQLARKEFVRTLKVQVGTTAAIGGGAILAGSAIRVGGGLLGAHRAREGSLMASRALGAGPVRAKRNRRGVYNVTSMGSSSRMGTGSRVRLGGQRMAAAVRYAANT